MPIEWKRQAIFGAAFGVALAIAAGLAIGLHAWVSGRQASWDESSVKGISTTAEAKYTLYDAETLPKMSGFDLTFVLENTTSQDYTISLNIKLFRRFKASGALEEMIVKLEHPYVLPSNERAEVRASVERACSPDDDKTTKSAEAIVNACFSDAFEDVVNLVAFDADNHLKITLQKPSLRSNKAASPNTPVMSPDRGKPWEMYAACAESNHLVPLCKNAGLDDSKAVADGWRIIGPLSTLPTLTEGIVRQPNVQVCRVAFEWEDYCRKHDMSH